MELKAVKDLIYITRRLRCDLLLRVHLRMAKNYVIYAYFTRALTRAFFTRAVAHEGRHGPRLALKSAQNEF